jgi:hypothetical protein
VGSALVRKVIARAQARGATAVVMEVLAENRQVITMIEDHWPVARRDYSGAYITISARLQPAVPTRPDPRPGAERPPWPAGSGPEPWRPAAREGRRSERLAGTR